MPVAGELAMGEGQWHGEGSMPWKGGVCSMLLAIEKGRRWCEGEKGR
jgi:hypothetical protein